MSMTAPTGHAFFAKAPPGDKTSQTTGASFSKEPWASNIWNSNKPIGSTFTPSKRDTMGSRGSDEASSTAPSGSAQLNHMSEAEPSWSARNHFWKNQEPSQGRSASGHTSPSQTRDNGIVQHGLQDASYFPGRSAVGQNGNTFPSRTNDHTPAFGGDDNDSNAPYLAPRHHFEQSNGILKRGSLDQSFINMTAARENSISSRPSDVVAGEMPQYSFDGNTYGNALNARSRPSMPHPMSFPSGEGASRGFPVGNAAMDPSLSELLRESLTLKDSDAGNPSFQFNPGSQSWQSPNDVGTNGRGFGQTYPQDIYAEQMPPAYFSRRPSASPAGNVPRPSLNSPRYTHTPNPRADSWPRPPSANPSMIQDSDRPPYSNFYPTGVPFYPNTYAPQYSQNGYYDPYGPNSVLPQRFPYGLPVNTIIPGVTVPNRPSKDKDPGQGMRSVLLEEFRASNKSNKRYELKDIFGHVVEFSGDQHGSRFIQEKLQTANSDDKEHVFREIQPNALQLMKDVFGNYVIQKFFEHGNQLQKKVLAREMNSKVAELSVQMYACRVVQKALEHVLVEQQSQIVEELRPDIMRIVKDQNGNHVIQKIISLAPQMCLPFMMNEFRGQISNLASHSYGCRVIQRMLEKGDESQRRELMEEVHQCAPQLIADQFGNYVAQHIIAHGQPEDRSRMICHVINELITLSKHKFASNVVEKCIEYGTSDEREAIRVKLTTQSPDGTSPLQMMMKDQFGNYVIQKLVNQLHGPERESFIGELEPQLDSLKRTTTGRQVTALERLSFAVGTSKSGAPGVPGTSRSMNTLRPTTTNQSSPALQIDINSVAPTPGLTTEHNSPESNSPPSTNLSMEDEGVEYKTRSKGPHSDGQPQLVVHDDEPER